MTIPPAHAVADHRVGLLLDVRPGALAASVAARVARALSARAGFTLDTYAHVTTDAQLKAAQTMGNILSRAV